MSDVDRKATLEEEAPVLRASIGSKGTMFLTSSVWLSHLKEGESIGPPVELAECDQVGAEFDMAVLEIQRQHGDMLRFLQEWVGDNSHNDWCDRVEDPAEDCIACAYEAMTDRWEASRV